MKYTSASILAGLAYASLGSAKTQQYPHLRGRGQLTPEVTQPPRTLSSTTEPTFEGSFNAVCCGAIDGCRGRFNPNNYDRLNYDSSDFKPCEEMCATRDDCTGFEFRQRNGGAGGGECKLWKVEIGTVRSSLSETRMCYKKLTTTHEVDDEEPPPTTTTMTTSEVEEVETTPSPPMGEQGAIVSFVSDYKYLNGEYFPSDDVVGGRAIWIRTGGPGGSRGRLVYYCDRLDQWIFTFAFKHDELVENNGGRCSGLAASARFSSLTVPSGGSTIVTEFWEYDWSVDGPYEMSPPPSSPAMEPSPSQQDTGFWMG